MTAIDKNGLYNYALGMLKSAVETALTELEAEGVKHPSLRHLSRVLSVTTALGDARRFVDGFETYQQLDQAVEKLWDETRGVAHV